MNPPLSIDPSHIQQSTCPACANHVAVPFFYGHRQPLATIAWPKSVKEAQTMEHLPIDFVRCVECGHIYNTAFNYANVPYSEKPNLMYNKGAQWSQFIRDLQERMLAFLPAKPVVVEIGHGDGSFLSTLSRLRPEGTYIGFDPHGATGGTGNVTLRSELFIPAIHLKELQPDFLIMRHVLEHLTNTLGFLQEIAFASAALGVTPLGYFEVPCVDRVVETGRTVDLYYEHSSQFTTGSFSRMLSCSNAEMHEIGHGYDGEVVYGFARFGRGAATMRYASEAAYYSAHSAQAHAAISAQLAALATSGKKVAIWGGTGKSAAFMNFFNADAKRFPVVVDSDPEKAGTFVPGTGQEIRYRDYLKGWMADVVIIPPQWRAADIVQEMHREDIAPTQVLIEHDYRLIDYMRDPHPYKKLA